MAGALFAALGMVAVLASATNTPIASIFMAAELFGMGITPFAAVACTASYLITGHRGVFPSQILAVSKSNSLEVPMEQELEQVDKVYYKNKEKTITAYIYSLIKRKK